MKIYEELEMTTLARKVYNAIIEDKIVLERLIERNTNQEIIPVGGDVIDKTEEYAYVFEDKSALIVNSYNHFRVANKYLKTFDHIYLQEYLD